MKKIGIITYYYQSINYGGNLQAYALCKKINDMGGQAEQICFNAQKRSVKSYGVLQSVKAGLLKAKNIIYKQNKKARFSQKIIKKREAAFYNFNSVLIPHSENVFVQDTIKNCLDEYDVFVTGSDQVWNPTWYVPAYFLDFVPSEKPKVSYATSFGVSNFSESQKECIKEHLKDFSLISLREHSVLEKEDVFPFEPLVLADPTLLLSKDEWSEVCAKDVPDERYVFCYFFGASAKSRTLARNYAKKNGCKIISIPHLDGYNSADVGFADVEFADASPEKFLALIKNAQCIFTDSFHAVVFSNIFNKEYFVFKRADADTMSSRIYSITQLFHSENRFCHTPEMMSMEYILSLNKLDYDNDNTELKELQGESFSFLNKILIGEKE